MEKYLLKLYITGKTSRTQKAIDNLQLICQEQLKQHFDIEIIDVLEAPEKAEVDKVIATPTLIRQLPPPIRRIVGDLNDREKVLHYLDIEKKRE